MGLFDSLSGHDSRMAAMAKAMGLERAQAAAGGLYNQGRTEARTAFGEAEKPFQALFDEGGVATRGYSDALGLNGPEGNAAARARFSTSPGYEFMRDEGLRGAERGFSAGGMLASGNLLDELTKRSVGYADQDWGDYLGRFKPLLDQRTTGATGLGAVRTGLGNLLNTSYGAEAGKAYDTEKGIGDAGSAGIMAGQQASQNRLAAIKDGLSFGTKLLGMF